jgi:Na+/proline symporter
MTCNSNFKQSFQLDYSDISGITILGSPAEIYKHGAQSAMTGVSRVIVAVFIITFIVPVVHDLQISSIFEVR